MLQELHNKISLRNKTFLFVKIETRNFQNLGFCETSQIGNIFIPHAWFSRRGEKQILPQVAKTLVVGFVFLSQVLIHKWGIKILP